MTLVAPGQASSRPTVATRSASRARALFDREHHFGRRGQRVAAQAHRRRARVAGDAVHADLEPRRAVDRGDDAERQALRLQHRPLLDMHLDEGGDVRAPKVEAPRSGSPPNAMSASRIETPLASR